MGQAPAAALVDLGRDHCCCESREALPCHAAASSGDIATLKSLLESRVSCCTMDCSGSTPLHVAAEKGHIRILELLLKSRANVDAQDICGERPIHKAVLQGKVENARMLIAYNADLQVRDVDGMTPAHAAASAGTVNDAMLRVLVKGRADLLAQSSNKETPIDRAMANGHIQLAHWLAHVATHVPEREQICADTARSLPEGLMGIPVLAADEDDLDQKLYLEQDSECASPRRHIESPPVSSRRHVESPPASSRRHVESPPASSGGELVHDHELGELFSELSGLGRALADEEKTESLAEEW